MTNEQANIFCYIFTGMSLKEFATKMLNDIKAENQGKEIIEREEALVY